MDFSIIDNLNKRLSKYIFVKNEIIIDKLNEIAGANVYDFSSVDKNIIKLKEDVDNKYIHSLGLYTNYSLNYPFIESLCPMNILCFNKMKNIISCIKDYSILNESLSDILNLQELNDTNLKVKKEYILWYFNELNNNGSKYLSKLSAKQRDLRYDVEELEKYYDRHLYQETHSWNYVKYNEIISKGYSVIELPIYPGPKTIFYIIKEQNTANLKFAHDVLSVNKNDYCKIEKVGNNIYKVPLTYIDEFNLIKLSNEEVKRVFPDILDFFYELNNVNSLKSEIDLLEENKKFIKSLKKGNNFSELIEYINRTT